MRHRTLRGKLSYRHDTKGETGREWFTVTVQPDGTRTHRAHCEMDEDGVLRDVVSTLDSRWYPRDAYVRLSVGGAFEGAAWFLIDGQKVTCDSWTRGAGRLHQSMTFDEPVCIFGGHPVSGDAMKPAHFDPAGPAIQKFLMVSTSPLPNGASGPIMAARHGVFEFIGEESVTVEAGTFACRRFRWHFEEFPPIELWNSGPDLIPVKVRWDLLESDYDLVEFSTD
ncbi:MAG: hypothetical protein O3C65_07960 [Proteobacteria bacterium]|nr:hypothetical protein [Pseudomonadota bacterium]MDA1058608.1 hypothetical protein [Pseudomonadota bacterium]